MADYDPDAGRRAYAQADFIRAHHPLISPWMFDWGARERAMQLILHTKRLEADRAKDGDAAQEA